jgi:hypothetical protein
MGTSNQKDGYLFPRGGFHGPHTDLLLFSRTNLYLGVNTNRLGAFNDKK